MIKYDKESSLRAQAAPLTPEKIKELKYQCDDLSSAALARLQEIYKAQSDAFPVGSKPKLDLYVLLREHHESDTLLAQLWDHAHDVPAWVDWAQLERGQRVFFRYGVANMIGFALQGFMGENAASPGIAEVLIRTGGFATAVVLRRALETFQWILQVSRSIDDIKPGGEGHIATLRVRLLHASVRQRMLKLVETRKEYFNIEEFGLPVNRLDDIHSIALFACNPLWLQLPKMGIMPRPQEIEDYVALFRYLGHLLAVPDGYFANPTAAWATMDAMCKYERRPTEASQVLCHNFIQALADVPPFNISAGFLEAGARIINGDELSDGEGTGKPGWINYMQFRGFCWLVQTLALVQRLSPKLDEKMIQLQHKWLYWYLIERGDSHFSLGGVSKFEMKYQPSIGGKTGKETNPGSALPVKAIVFRPLETLFVICFIVRCTIVLLPLLFVCRFAGGYLVHVDS